MAELKEKLEYEKPTIEVIEIEAEDVITTSSPSNIDDDFEMQ